jgi:hypothetical protein
VTGFFEARNPVSLLTTTKGFRKRVRIASRLKSELM